MDMGTDPSCVWPGWCSRTAGRLLPICDGVSIYNVANGFLLVLLPFLTDFLSSLDKKRVNASRCTSPILTPRCSAIRSIPSLNSGVQAVGGSHLEKCTFLRVRAAIIFPFDRYSVVNGSIPVNYLSSS